MPKPSDVLGGEAFSQLPEVLKEKLLEQIRTRRTRYELARQRGYSGSTKVIILGDKPGPGRPTTENYHHTPFYSTRNSSLWVNQMLLEAGIDEKELLWFNVEHADGTALDPIHLEDLSRFHPTIICLGGNAEKWARRHAPTSRIVKVFHPSFAKRFKSKEPYALIDEIKKALK